MRCARARSSELARARARATARGWRPAVCSGGGTGSCTAIAARLSRSTSKRNAAGRIPKRQICHSLWAGIQKHHAQMASNCFSLNDSWFAHSTISFSVSVLSMRAFFCLALNCIPIDRERFFADISNTKLVYEFDQTVILTVWRARDYITSRISISYHLRLTVHFHPAASKLSCPQN